MGIEFENPMDMGLGMGMTFENGYGYGYGYGIAIPSSNPPHDHPYLPSSSTLSFFALSHPKRAIKTPLSLSRLVAPPPQPPQLLTSFSFLDSHKIPKKNVVQNHPKDDRSPPPIATKRPTTSDRCLLDKTQDHQHVNLTEAG